MCTIHEGIRRIRHTGDLTADRVLCIAIILITIDKTVKSIICLFIHKETLDTCRITVKLCRAPRVKRQCRFINRQSATAADIIVSRYIFTVVPDGRLSAIRCQIITAGIRRVARFFILLILSTWSHHDRVNDIPVCQTGRGRSLP